MSSELNETQVRIYLYIATRGGNTSVREIARELNLPPSTVHYNLKRLVELGYLERTPNGYSVKKPLKLTSHVILGKLVVPRFLLYGLFFAGVFTGTVIYTTLAGLNPDRLLLLVVSFLAALLMVTEVLVMRNKIIV